MSSKLVVYCMGVAQSPGYLREKQEANYVFVPRTDILHLYSFR